MHDKRTNCLLGNKQTICLGAQPAIEIPNWFEAYAEWSGLPIVGCGLLYPRTLKNLYARGVMHVRPR